MEPASVPPSRSACSRACLCLPTYFHVYDRHGHRLFAGNAGRAAGAWFARSDCRSSPVMARRGGGPQAWLLDFTWYTGPGVSRRRKADEIARAIVLTTGGDTPDLLSRS